MVTRARLVFLTVRLTTMSEPVVQDREEDIRGRSGIAALKPE